ncbi:MAG: tape measure protein [Pseudomonadota bacterium]
MAARETVLKLLLQGLGGRQGREDISRLTNQLLTLESVFQRLKAATVAAFDGWGISAVVTALLEAGIQTERLDSAFTAIRGSAAAGRTELEYLRLVANRLGQDYLSAANGAKSLYAAAADSSLGLRETRNIYLGISEAAATLGISADETQGIFLALGQMISKGSVQSEELKGQLGERLPGAMSVLAKAMGVNVAVLTKWVESGKLTAEQIIPKLSRALEERFGRTAVEAADKAQGSLNRLGNAWYELKKAVNESGFLDVATGVIKQVHALVQTLTGLVKANKEQITDWMESAADRSVEAFRVIMLGSAGVLDTLAPMMKHISDLVGNLWDDFKRLPTWVQEVGIIGAFLSGKNKTFLAIGVAVEKLARNHERMIALSKYQEAGFKVWSDPNMSVLNVKGQIEAADRQISFIERNAEPALSRRETERFVQELEAEKVRVEASRQATVDKAGTLLSAAWLPAGMGAAANAARYDIARADEYLEQLGRFLSNAQTQLAQAGPERTQALRAIPAKQREFAADEKAFNLELTEAERQTVEVKLETVRPKQTEEKPAETSEGWYTEAAENLLAALERGAAKVGAEKAPIKIEGVDPTKGVDVGALIGVGKGGQGAKSEASGAAKAAKSTQSLDVEAATSRTGPAKAKIEAELADLERLHERGLATTEGYYAEQERLTEEYYAKRQALVAEKQRVELAGVKELAAAAKAPLEQTRSQGDLDQLLIEQERERVELAEEQRQAEEKVTVQKMDQLQLQQEAQDQTRALLANWSVDTLPANMRDNQDARFAEEWESRRDQLELQLADVESFETRMDAVREFFHLKELARKQTDADEAKAREEARLAIAGESAGQLANIFGDLYELSGKKNKEFFALEKAAASAEVVIRTQAAIMKALETSGWAGYAQAGLIAAQGAVSLAIIQAQGLAEGGLVRGSSPDKKADNIPARLTAGEYVHQVDAVRHYGRETMDRINRREIPKDALEPVKLAGGGLVVRTTTAPREDVDRIALDRERELVEMAEDRRQSEEQIVAARVKETPTQSPGERGEESGAPAIPETAPPRGQSEEGVEVVSATETARLIEKVVEKQSFELPQGLLDMFEKEFALPTMPSYTPMPSRFSDNGYVAPAAATGASGSNRPVEITTVNVLDQSEITNALASQQGQAVILNVMSRNAPKVRRMLDGSR